ncbi:MAG: hypothetical protein Q9217_000381 [Psora testacea]
MATVFCSSMHTGTKLVLPRDEMIAQVIRCEKQTFSRNEVLDFDIELKKRNLELIIVVDDGSMALTKQADVDVAAYMVLSFTKPGNRVTLHKICVQPKYRAQGLASRILRAQIEILKRRGCSKLQLWVDESNNLARRLYVRTGFQKVNSVVDYYAPGRTGVQMVFQLSS